MKKEKIMTISETADFQGILRMMCNSNTDILQTEADKFVTKSNLIDHFMKGTKIDTAVKLIDQEELLENVDWNSSCPKVLQSEGHYYQLKIESIFQ